SNSSRERGCSAMKRSSSPLRSSRSRSRSIAFAIRPGYARVSSLDDAVREVGDGGGLDHPGALQFALIAEVLEQPHSVAQEHGDEVDLQFVEEAGLQVLLSDMRAAGHPDVLLAGCRFGLLERGLDAVGDEGERGPALLGHRLA